MGLSDKKYSYDKLGEINTNGIEVAQFPQIRDAIADRMREIYGDDIDLSTASADGQYINMEALILNNVYKLLSNLYDNVNPFVATGKYLDILCSLTNVKRKGSTRSTAGVYIKNVSGSTVSDPYIQLIDRNGIQWTWTNPTDLGEQPTITFAPGKIYTLTFTCDEYGPIEAYANPVQDPETDINWDASDFTDTNGDIYKTVDYGSYKVYQASDAIIGLNEESDEDLRRRRYNFLGANSITTQAGLEAALYNRDDIVDVYVLNNASGSNMAAGDGVTVENHNIYIALRYKDGVEVDDNSIAKTIYNKLTPGINTQAYDSVSGSGGEASAADPIQLYSGVETTVCWKICKPVNPLISIAFTVDPRYYKKGDLTGGTVSDPSKFSEFETAIMKQLNRYLSGIKINETLVTSSLSSTMMGADLKPQGYSSFYVTTCSITGGVPNTSANLAPLTYYEYNTYSFYYSGNQATLGISYTSN